MQGKGEGRKALSALRSVRGLGRVADTRAGTKPPPACPGSLAPRGQGTSATWPLAGNLSSFPVAEGQAVLSGKVMGARLCSFLEIYCRSLLAGSSSRVFNILT